MSRAGYEVRAVGKDANAVRETARWSDVVILALPYEAAGQVLDANRDVVAGKPIIDVTNPLTPDYQLALGFTTSAAEQLQAKAPSAKMVKAFNYLFAPQMATGTVNNTTLSLFVAGDDDSAKGTVQELGRDLGFDAIDSGPLTNARWLEALGYLNIQLGFMQKMGTNIGFKLVR